MLDCTADIRFVYKCRRCGSIGPMIDVWPIGYDDPLVVPGCTLESLADKELLSLVAGAKVGVVFGTPATVLHKGCQTPCVVDGHKHYRVGRGVADVVGWYIHLDDAVYKERNANIARHCMGISAHV